MKEVFTKIEKVRLDQLLVERGLEANQNRAKARIMAGDVIVGDKRQDKPGTKVVRDVLVRIRGNSHPYVSRGGLKLQEAISSFPAPIKDAICIDVGASTGGFTQVLLKEGAQMVYAVDVGYGQLAHELRSDPRVINLERTHILHLSSLPKKPSIAVIDVSFISLTKVLPAVLALLSRPAFIYVLIKPQFEVGREHIAKGGIVKEEPYRHLALEKVLSCARGLGMSLLGYKESPITGAKGNVEYIAAFSFTE